MGLVAGIVSKAGLSLFVVIIVKLNSGVEREHKDVFSSNN